MATIYALCDPRKDDPKESIRYVGVTKRTLSQRMSVHMANARNEQDQCHRVRWIRKLLRDGVEPVIVALEEAPDDGRAAERRIIADYRSAGYRLTNATDGGDGNWGWTPGNDTRARIGAAIARAWQDPEFKARMSADRKAKRNTPEWRQAASQRLKQLHVEDPGLGARLAAKRKPRVMPEEERQLRSECMRRRWQDPAYRARVTSAVGSQAVRAKIGAATSRRCQDLAYRARLADAVKAGRDEEWLARQSVAQRAAWSDPARRAGRAAAMCRGWSNHPESKKRVSNAAKTRCRTEEGRRRLSEQARTWWADPEKRARWMAARWPHRVTEHETNKTTA